MPRDYAKEYRKETESIEFLRVRIPKELKDKLRQQTANDNTSISAWVLKQIEYYVNEPPK